MNSLKLNKGVTIVSLIITVIVLLILAGTTVSLLMGDSGIIVSAQVAADKYKEAELYEQNLVLELQNYIYNGGRVTTDEEENNQGQQDEEEGAKKGGEWSDTKKVNSPKLDIKSMIPVKWNGTNWVICTDTDNDWYNYIAQSTYTNAVGSGTSKWANVMLSDGAFKATGDTKKVKKGSTEIAVTKANEDAGKLTVQPSELGSMFVWIPRFAYNIESGAHDSGSGKISVEFLQGISRTGAQTSYENIDSNGQIKAVTENATKNGGKWIIHPSFLGNTSVGGWSEDLPGYWVAKFEASKDNSKIRILPNEYSWTKIYESAAFEACMNMRQEDYQLSSVSYPHQMKNSEWGAVAYLAHSQYGRNGSRISINNKGNITGYSGGTNTVANDSGDESFTYETPEGTLASTTGNIYGIYDMVGGAYEFVAAEIEGSINAWKSVDKKYYDTYKMTGDGKNIYDNYAENKLRYGDAIYETSKASGTASIAAWYSNYSTYLSVKNFVFLRGGHYTLNTSAGIFAFTSRGDTLGSNYSFRPSIVVE